MSRDPLRLADYLEHIRDAISRITDYCEDLDEVGFLHNQLVQDAVIRNFEIIGEASKNIQKSAPDFVAAHPDLPFLPAYTMRNLLAHGYYKVDLDVIWKTISRDLPLMYEQINRAIESLRK